MLEQGQTFTQDFSYSQEEVVKFAEVSGDFNPLHLDPDYAAQTVFKKPIIHGFLGASVFSKILGMDFPGKGTVYLKQNMEFKRPLFTGTTYQAILAVKDIDREKHSATLETKILDKETGKLMVTGEALVLNKEKI